MKKSLRPVPRSQFCEAFIALNGSLLADFKNWLFRPGMLFGSLQKWWQEGAARQRPHEGIDLCLYRATEGGVHALTGAVTIPAAYDGRIAKIINDFLGKSIFVRHRVFSGGAAMQLCSVYGHTLPADTLREGNKVSAGEPLAVLPASHGSKSRIPSHLHLTLLWLPESFPDQRLNWQAVQSMAFCDPLAIFPNNYQILY